MVSLNSPVKLSTSSRAYLHLTDSSHLASLSSTVQQSSFIDARNTSNSASLLGPPVVEFAPFGRTPSDKRRVDARQGTIDQDPEFIAFLESLTNPTSAKKAPTEGSAGADSLGKKEEKVTMTPLVQYLKDKKNSKVKETLPVKSSRGRQEPRESRSDKGGEKKILSKPAKEVASPEVKKATREREKKVQKATTEVIRVLNREASATSGKAKAAPSLPPVSSNSKDGGVQSSIPLAPAAERKRERGNASIAAKILQRDLGLGGAPPRRGAARGESTSDGAKSETPSKPTISPPIKQEGHPSTAVEKTRSTEVTTSGDKAPPSGPNSEKENHRKSRSERRAHRFSNDQSSPLPRNPPTGPAAPLAILKKSTTSVQQPRPGTSLPKGPLSTTNPPPSLRSATSAPPTIPAATKATANAPPSAGATQAFCKHANASQGITEPALREAMEIHGAIVKVEIDKKKGFGYVDFAEPEGLVNAIKASPVKVGNGSVVVLERKERLPASSVGGAGSLPDKGKGRASGGASSAGRASGLEVAGRGGGRSRGRGRGGPPRGPAAGSAQAPAAAAVVAPPTGPITEAVGP
jgi:regulator of nonsense transcripts 3